MANRMITYGYEIRSGKILISEQEAEVVRRIFSLYAKGEGLKNIADKLSEEHIEYYEGNTQWNKNRVERILANEKYIGQDEYPVILTVEEFEKAHRLKEEKSFKMKRCNSLIEYLKSITYCGVCGKKIYRDPMWSRREKWVCRSGCSINSYISDAEIVHAILNAMEKVKTFPELISDIAECSFYERTPEVLRYQNEIGRIIDSANPSFDLGKKVILECAAVKFQYCHEDENETYGSLLKKLITSSNVSDFLNEKFLMKVLSKLKVNSDGSITVRLKNGVEILVEAKNGNAGKKNSNKNRSKSAISKAE